MLKHFGELGSLCPAHLTDEHLVWSSCPLIAYIPLHIELLMVRVVLLGDNLVVMLGSALSRLVSLLYIYLNFFAAFQALYVFLT